MGKSAVEVGRTGMMGVDRVVIALAEQADDHPHGERHRRTYLGAGRSPHTGPEDHRTVIGNKSRVRIARSRLDRALQIANPPNGGRSGPRSAGTEPFLGAGAVHMLAGNPYG
jgi:hypothetical protein